MCGRLGNYKPMATNSYSDHRSRSWMKTAINLCRPSLHRPHWTSSGGSSGTPRSPWVISTPGLSGHRVIRLVVSIPYLSFVHSLSLPLLYSHSISRIAGWARIELIGSRQAELCNPSHRPCNPLTYIDISLIYVHRLLQEIDKTLIFYYSRESLSPGKNIIPKISLATPPARFIGIINGFLRIHKRPSNKYIEGPFHIWSNTLK